jgi:hypothetical protein
VHWQSKGPDPANRVERITLAGAAGSTLLDAGDAYAWNALSRPIRFESGQPAAGGLAPELIVAYPGFERGYDSLDRLASASGLGASGLSPAPLGATWAWGGASRLYAMTTRGAFGTSLGLGYHLGGRRCQPSFRERWLAGPGELVGEVGVPVVPGPVRR